MERYFAYFIFALLLLFIGVVIGATLVSVFLSNVKIESGQILLGGIGFLALAAPLLNTIQSRRHNMLMVKPLLNRFLGVENLENGGFNILFSISNSGLGPAIISKCKVRLLNDEVDWFYIEQEKVYEFLNKNINSVPITYNIKHSVTSTLLLNNEILPPGESITLFKILFCHQGHSNPTEDVVQCYINLLMNVFTKIDGKIEYKCQYNISETLRLSITDWHNIKE